jgi:hypothetical protein
MEASVLGEGPQRVVAVDGVRGLVVRVSGGGPSAVVREDEAVEEAGVRQRAEGVERHGVLLQPEVMHGAMQEHLRRWMVKPITRRSLPVVSLHSPQ